MAQHFKLNLKFEGISPGEPKCKEKLENLLGAVITKYPLLVKKDQSKDEVAELTVARETLFIKLPKDFAHENVVKLDHIVNYIRIAVKSIHEDTTNCISLLENRPGLHFEETVKKLRLTDPDNAELVILSDPPIRTSTNLVLWPSKHFPLEYTNEEQESGLIKIIEDGMDIQDDRLLLANQIMTLTLFPKGGGGIHPPKPISLITLIFALEACFFCV
jgi:hypothetical protein